MTTLAPIVGADCLVHKVEVVPEHGGAYGTAERDVWAECSCGWHGPRRPAVKAETWALGDGKKHLVVLGQPTLADWYEWADTLDPMEAASVRQTLDCHRTDEDLQLPL